MADDPPTPTVDRPPTPDANGDRAREDLLTALTVERFSRWQPQTRTTVPDPSPRRDHRNAAGGAA
jgi:hypothetical protein